MAERSPTVRPSDRRPPAISREARSQSAQLPVCHALPTFQRSACLSAPARTRLLNSSTALGTLSGRSFERVVATVAIAAKLVVSICEFVRQSVEDVKRMLDWIGGENEPHALRHARHRDPRPGAV